MQRWKALGCPAALLWLVANLGVLAGCGSETSGESYRNDFREGLDSNMFQLFGGDDPAVHNKLTDDGLHVMIPKDAESVSGAGVMGRFVLQGDFVLTARYHTQRLTAPTGVNGAGAILVIDDAAGQVASIQKVMLSDESNRFISHVALKDADGNLDHQVQTHPASGTHGQIRLSRVGTRLRYEVKVEGAADFTSLDEEEFSDNDVTQFHLGAQTGGESPCDVSVIWQDLQIEADKINSLSDRVRREPEWGSRYPYMLGVMALLAVGIAIILAWRRSREE